jgi:hypothetical protein
VAILWLCLGSGCASEPEPTPVVVAGDGLLTVDWSIDDAKDPRLCGDEAADSIDVIVTTAGGAIVGEFSEYCEAFALSIRLPSGSYDADASLLDANGAQRTSSVSLGGFSLFGGDELVVPIDFPYDSFY